MAARTVSRISLGTAAKACSEQAAWISRAAEASNMVFCCKLAVMARAVAASRLSPTLLTMCIIISDLESRMRVMRI